MNQTTNPGEVIITVDHLVSVDEGGAPVSRCASTPLGHLYRAEVAAARGDSEAALAEIDAAGALEPAETRRAELIRAELAIQAGDCATAEAIAYAALGAAGAAGDRSAETRARIVAVRAKVRDGRFRSALADLPMLRRECNEFRTAICDHLAAVSHLKLGDREQALDLALAAIHTFRACGAVRWEGWARNVIGLVLTDRGELDAAIREFEHAEKLAAECAATTLEQRVRARLNVAPIRVEDDVVTVDTSRGLPKLDDAVNAVKRHLMARALDAAEGNQSRAADLIGMDRSRYHYQWRVLRGLDPRPVKRGETTE